MGIGAAWAAHPFVLAMLLGSLRRGDEGWIWGAKKHQKTMVIPWPRSRMAFFILAYSGVLSTFKWLELAASLGPKGFDATASTFALYFGGLEPEAVGARWPPEYS